MERNIALPIAAVTLLLIGAAILLPGGRPVDPDPKVPWKIEVNEDGSSTVLGLTLGTTTLGQTETLFDEEAKFTLFVRKSGEKTVEAYFERVFLSGLRADMVMALELGPEEKQAMYDRGTRIAKLGSGDKKVTMHPDDIVLARRAAIRHITYLPVTDLDEELLERRFGTPGQRIPANNGVVHWLYPDRGLDIAVDPDRKEVFQYVAPRDFEELVTIPLQRAAAAAEGPDS